MSDVSAVPAARQRFAPAATITVVLSLLGLNLGNHLLGWNSLWLGPVGAVGLIVFARASGLTWHQLGLARSTHAAGLRWGGMFIGAVAAVYLVGVLLPVTRTAFLDVRYHLPPASILFTAFVLIPLGTVLLEEVAFRSVLWGMLARHARMWQVLLGSSLLFGLWHVIPATASADGNAAIGSVFGALGGYATLALIVGTVLFTAVGGLVAGELRRRSGSLLASVGMHWATNGLGVLFGSLAWRLAF
ncbi:CPBP family intramembrane metalloprotease [Ornithinimicrobium ciconiae]|uniref:CPBP family intramembrane metalloprotease n=1 Tax=Ornithinimicrobium ciconiae TaxID=2594265 RepID=A0A516GC76_9MICO|nr:CPBP family glutamic-type intramembrane protease [Ornithinimicrobium ciconiae]QDO89129.1 CPBP family intramembrane metalloprotease [Ornithinimicrobium ciconiae]